MIQIQFLHRIETSECFVWNLLNFNLKNFCLKKINWEILLIWNHSVIYKMEEKSDQSFLPSFFRSKIKLEFNLARYYLTCKFCC